MANVQVQDRDEEEWAALIAKELFRITKRFSSQPAFVVAQSLLGEEATKAVEELIHIKTGELKRKASAYSRLKWLWLLRRTPRVVFEGTLPSTHPYDSGLAEVLTSQSTATSQLQNRNSRQWRYFIDRPLARRVAEFCFGVRMLSNLHSAYRVAAKGGIIEVGVDGTVRWELENDHAEAISRFDNRAYNATVFGGRSGTSLSLESNQESKDVLLLMGRVEGKEVEVKVGLDIPGYPSKVSIRAKYVPIAAPAEEIFTLLERSQASYPQLLGDVIVLARAAFLLAKDHPTGAYSMMRRGYILTNEAFVVGKIEDVLRHDALVGHRVSALWGGSSAKEVLSRLRSIMGHAFPLRTGSPIREERNAVCVDLLACHSLIGRALEFPPIEGKTANVRGRHFEGAVQREIDESSWAPPPHFRKLRGVTLRINNQAVTDADAIGFRDGVLLLVSCKSAICGESYDAGHYSTIRNRESLVNDAISSWASKISKLELDKKGDNYDLTSAQSLIGTVCTPTPIYRRSKPIEVVPGLSDDTTIMELRQWLNDY